MAKEKYYAINIVITFLFVLVLKYYAVDILITIIVFVGTKVLCYEHLLIVNISMTTADVGIAYLSIQ